MKFLFFKMVLIWQNFTLTCIIYSCASLYSNKNQIIEISHVWKLAKIFRTRKILVPFPLYIIRLFNNEKNPEFLIPEVE